MTMAGKVNPALCALNILLKPYCIYNALNYANENFYKKNLAESKAFSIPTAHIFLLNFTQSVK